MKGVCRFASELLKRAEKVIRLPLQTFFTDVVEGRHAGSDHQGEAGPLMAKVTHPARSDSRHPLTVVSAALPAEGSSKRLSTAARGLAYRGNMPLKSYLEFWQLASRCYESSVRKAAHAGYVRACKASQVHSILPSVMMPVLQRLAEEVSTENSTRRQDALRLLASVLSEPEAGLDVDQPELLDEFAKRALDVKVHPTPYWTTIPDHLSSCHEGIV